MTKCDYDHLRHRVRWLRRQNRTYLIIAALCLGLGASQLWRAERMAIRNGELQSTIAEIQDSVDAYPVAIYGLNYALNAEQAKAGEYEARWLDRVEKLASARGYIGKLRGELKQCNATNEMVTGEGWTGSAYIQPGDE